MIHLVYLVSQLVYPEPKKQVFYTNCITHDINCSTECQQAMIPNVSHSTLIVLQKAVYLAGLSCMQKGICPTKAMEQMPKATSASTNHCESTKKSSKSRKKGR